MVSAHDGFARPPPCPHSHSLEPGDSTATGNFGKDTIPTQETMVSGDQGCPTCGWDSRDTQWPGWAPVTSSRVGVTRLCPVAIVGEMVQPTGLPGTGQGDNWPTEA